MAKDLVDLHQYAMVEFDKIYDASYPERAQCLEDRRFYSIAGAQWEGALGEQFDEKLRLEANKVHLAVIRIFNEYRNNRISANFLADDQEAEDDAETLAGLYRATESRSLAKESYDGAFEEAVGGGFGAWRLRADYEDEESDGDEQVIYIEPIYDADQTVFFDLSSRRQDKSDAKSCYVLTPMSPEHFEAEYGHTGSSFREPGSQQYNFDWVRPDAIYVAEYYAVEDFSVMVHFFTSATGDIVKVDHNDLKEESKILLATGYKETRKKKIKRKRVHKYIMSGTRVEEDCGYLAGRHIPIIPVYGKRWFVDGIERMMGHVRLSKDSQRLKNMQMSKYAEIAALSPIEKPIFYPEEVAGHEQTWADDNIKNYPYLLINRIKDANGQFIPASTGYTRAPNIPPALAALHQMTDGDLQELLGSQQVGDQLSPTMSGKAVELIQTRLDMLPFIYISNMAKAVEWGATVWLSMASDLMTEEGRKVKVMDGAGKTSQTELLKKVFSEKLGKTVTKNDFGNRKFNVTVDVGPSSVSKKAATVRALTGMMSITTDPDSQKVLGAAAMMNMEGEGVAEIRNYFRKQLVQMGAAKPTKEEEAEMKSIQPPPPDPQAVYLEAAAQEALAKGAKAESDAMLAVAKAELTRAQTVEIAASMDNEQQDRLLQYAESLDTATALPTQNASQEGVLNVR